MPSFSRMALQVMARSAEEESGRNVVMLSRSSAGKLARGFV